MDFSCFQKKSVDAVLAAFTKVIADLHAVEQNNLNERDRQKTVAANASALASFAHGEAQRAATVRAKIEAIVA